MSAIGKALTASSPVLRRRAWEIADQLGWASTYIAGYVALTQLQADAFVTTSKKLARTVASVVSVGGVAWTLARLGLRTR